MSQILFFSDNTELIDSWSSVLSTHYQTNTVSDLATDFTADVTIVDADKIIENKNLLSLLNKKTTRFLIIGNNWSEQCQIKAIASGAVGYCNKTEPSTLLLQAVERILKGDIWIQRHLVSEVIGALVKIKYATAEIDSISKQVESSKLLSTLSSRERDVATMIRSGDSNKAIASSLFISERTVKAHLTSIFKKLSIPDRLHLALFIKEFD